MSNEQLNLILELPGERIDKALAEVYPDISRTQWQQLIKDGSVTVEGEPVKPSFRLEAVTEVHVVLPEVQETDLVAQEIPLEIVYEDEDFLAINKPAGMVVHPAPGHSKGTLVNAVLGYCPELEGVGGERRPGIVHRLDKETSGVILVAKNDGALRHLQRQFKRRTIEKKYLALVEGQIQPPKALIDAPIGRDPTDRQKMAVIRPGSGHRARKAQTEYHLVRNYGNYSLVACFPRTGRTHQIRVHLAFAGYPIAGDSVYGRRKQKLALARHFLHAATLHLKRPADDAPLTLEAPLPAELEAVLQELATGDG